MPRVARFRIAAIGELYRQLRFAPRATKTREMNAAEKLVADIDPDLNYPQDFVVYRITGYRPESGDEPLTFVGAALLGDLATFIQHLSDGLDLPWEYDGRSALTIEEVAGKLRVSTKTVQRYRRLGLVCHYVLTPQREPQLVCFEDALRRFTERNREQTDRAAVFTRVDGAAGGRVIEEARRLRETEGLSLNEAALRISRKMGRAHETVRGMLRRHDREAAEPVFTESGPLSERDVRLIDRAARWGVSDLALAGRFGKTPATIRRARNRRRAIRLARLDLRWVDLPTFGLADAEHVILSAPPAVHDLDALLPASDALELIAAAHAAPGLDRSTASALVGAYNLLKRRARGAIDALPAWPGSAELDRIEADLRWATRLQRRLVSLGLPVAIGRVEQNLHLPLASQPADRIMAMLDLARSVVSRVVESIDPSRDQHLDRLTGYSMDRALAALASSIDEHEGRPRAAARHEPGAIALDGMLAGLSPWEHLLELRSDLVPLVGDLDAADAGLVRDHFGLGATPPVSPADLAAQHGSTPAVVMRRLRGAVLRLRETLRRRD